MCHWQSATNEASIKDRYNRTKALVLLSVFVSFARSIALFEGFISRRTLAAAFHDFNYTLVQILRDRQRTPSIE